MSVERRKLHIFGIRKQGLFFGKSSVFLAIVGSNVLAAREAGQSRKVIIFLAWDDSCAHHIKSRFCSMGVGQATNGTNSTFYWWKF